jgi:hypothetical protein
MFKRLGTILKVTRNFQSNKTGLSRVILAAIVIVIVLIATVGAYYFSSSSSPASPSPTPYTGSPSPTVENKSPSPSGSVSVTGAKTLQFSVSLTEGGVNTGSFTYYAKNVDEISNSYKWGRTANFMMRIEQTDSAGVKMITVLDAPQQKAWVYSSGKWEDVSVGFASQFDALNAQWLGFFNSLKGWSGSGDLRYSANGEAVRIYDVLVNPSLSGSLFGPN